MLAAVSKVKVDKQQLLPLLSIFLVALLLAFQTILLVSRATALRLVQSYDWTHTFVAASTQTPGRAATDSAGNVYQAGSFLGTVDFDPGAGTDSFVNAGAADMYVTKTNADGTYGWTRVYSGFTALGETFNLAVDNSDNIYFSSGYSGTVDFDTGAGTDSIASGAGVAAFITKFSASSTYAWTKVVANGSQVSSYGLATDSNNNIYSVGVYDATTDFNPNGGTDSKPTVAAIFSAYLTTLASDGTYRWTRTLSTGNDIDFGTSVAVDGDDNIFMSSASLDGSFQGHGVFEKYNDSGTLLWQKSLDTNDAIGINDIAVDSTGNVYLAGYWHGTADFDPGAGTVSRVNTDQVNGGGLPSNDVYIAKYDADGDYVWTDTINSNTNLSANVFGIRLDPSDELYAVGNFASANSAVDFNPGAGTDNKTSAGVQDAFLLNLENDGTYIEVQTIGGTSAQVSTDLAIDDNYNLYWLGHFNGTTDFDPGAGTDNAGSGSSSTQDIFMTKLATTVYHHIFDLPVGLGAGTTTGTSLDDELVDDGVEEGDSETVRLSTDTNIPIADIDTQFDDDLDWSGVGGDSDPTTHESFVENLTSAPGTDSTYTLYVPYEDGDDAVVLCPDADSFSEVESSCDDAEIYTDADGGVDIVTIDSEQYWAVAGLTSTSGIASITAPAGAGSGSSSTDDSNLINTGDNILLWIVPVSLLIFGIIGYFIPTKKASSF